MYNFAADLQNGAQVLNPGTSKVVADLPGFEPVTFRFVHIPLLMLTLI